MGLFLFFLLSLSPSLSLFLFFLLFLLFFASLLFSSLAEVGEKRGEAGFNAKMLREEIRVESGEKRGG